MTSMTAPSEILQRIVTDGLSQDEERTLIGRLVQQQPPEALSLLPLYVEQKHRYKAGLEEARRALAELRQPPWHPATVIRPVPGPEPRALIAVGTQRLVVRIASEVDVEALRCGTAVLVSQDMRAILALAEEMPRAGRVGTFSRLEDGLAVLGGPADEEVAVDLADDLRGAGLEAGDRLLYDRDVLVATARVGRASEAAHRLEETPDVSFEDIGGLGEVIEEIRTEITLHAFHQDLVRAHRLKPVKGLLLSGPPGCGKTMVAKAVAHHLAGLAGVQATFLVSKPGSHRSMWYGQSEANVRELFRAARQAADREGRFAVLFFDDVDHLGSRTDHATAAVDSRLVPSFLAEIDGLAELSRVWLLGATNRPDLIDEALLRPGRFGDKLFRIPRPGRLAAADILRKHLRPDLPYHGLAGRDASAVIEEIIEATLAMLYAPNGEAHTLAMLVFRDGSRSPLTAPALVSGALIAQAVAEAKRRSCVRGLRSQPTGLVAGDLLTALACQLTGIVARLRPGPALREMLDLPPDKDVVHVEIDQARRLPPSHEYLR